MYDPSNKPLIVVTRDVSQSETFPYVLRAYAWLYLQELRALLMFASVIVVTADAGESERSKTTNVYIATE